MPQLLTTYNNSSYYIYAFSPPLLLAPASSGKGNSLSWESIEQACLANRASHICSTTLKAINEQVDFKYLSKISINLKTGEMCIGKFKQNCPQEQYTAKFGVKISQGVIYIAFVNP